MGARERALAEFSYTRAHKIGRIFQFFAFLILSLSTMALYRFELIQLLYADLVGGDETFRIILLQSMSFGLILAFTAFLKYLSYRPVPSKTDAYSDPQSVVVNVFRYVFWIGVVFGMLLIGCNFFQNWTFVVLWFMALEYWNSRPSNRYNLVAENTVENLPAFREFIQTLGSDLRIRLVQGFKLRLHTEKRELLLGDELCRDKPFDEVKLLLCRKVIEFKRLKQARCYQLLFVGTTLLAAYMADWAMREYFGLALTESLAQSMVNLPLLIALTVFLTLIFQVPLYVIKRYEERLSDEMTIQAVAEEQIPELLGRVTSYSSEAFTRLDLPSLIDEVELDYILMRLSVKNAK